MNVYMFLYLAKDIYYLLKNMVYTIGILIITRLRKMAWEKKTCSATLLIFKSIIELGTRG